MKKLGFSLAVSLIPLPAMAVTTVVDAGTTQTGGLVNPVQTQQVYGTANSFSVYGNQQVMSGGVTNDSNVYAGGQQNISSGGTSNGSNIQANAIQTIIDYFCYRFDEDQNNFEQISQKPLAYILVKFIQFPEKGCFISTISDIFNALAV